MSNRSSWYLVRLGSRVAAILSVLALCGIQVVQAAPSHDSSSGRDQITVIPGSGRQMPAQMDTSRGKDFRMKQIKMPAIVAGELATTSTVIDLWNPIVFVHGLSPTSSIACRGSGGDFSNPINYLKTWSAIPSNITGYGRGHTGLNSGQTLVHQGTVTTVGYYGADRSCDVQISTRFASPYTNNCNNYPTGTYNNSPSVGTNDEPIEHVACELAWYVYNRWGSAGCVEFVAHSMGGLVVRHMIEKTIQHNSHFPSGLPICDVITWSTPHGGITYTQEFQWYNFQCDKSDGSLCYQLREMKRSSTQGTHPFMQDLLNNCDGCGADWTMMGSLSSDDPLDWFWQSTYQSNSHRLGYSLNIPACSGQPGWRNGYDHGNYDDDMCDEYNAPQYYRDWGGRDDQTFYYTTGAPHSLHNTLIAMYYYGW